MARLRRRWTAEEDTLLRRAVENGMSPGVAVPASALFLLLMPIVHSYDAGSSTPLARLG